MHHTKQNSEIIQLKTEMWLYFMNTYTSEIFEKLKIILVEKLSKAS